MIRNIIIKFQRNSTKLHLHQYTRSLTQKSSSPSSKALADDYELQQCHIEEAIKTTPILMNIPRVMWKDAHETFLNHGLSTTNFLRIVTGNPKVLMRSPRKIVDSLEIWRSCQFGEYHLFLLITKYPFLLDVEDNSIFKTINLLECHLSGSKNVWKMLMNCPTVIEDSEKTLKAKILYIKENMRIEVPEIVKSGALGKSLEDIECRHVFLLRLGIFQPKKLKTPPGYISKNPRLYKITDTSEKSFATKLCHVHLEEYEAFKELYARERKQKEEDCNEDDDLLTDDESEISFKEI